MADYSPTEIVDMIGAVAVAGGNYTQAALSYAQQYPNRRHPTKVTIRTLVTRARHGNLKRQRQQHEYGVNDNRAIVVMAHVFLDPKISSRQIERESGIRKDTILRILKKNKFHAYHVTLTQELLPQDFPAHLQFCNWALARIQEDHQFFNFVLFSDEATFKNNGELNRHNSHYWSDVNPHWQRTVDNQHRWSLNVWCGIVNGFLIGPYFFDGTVTGAKYLDLLQNHLPGLLANVDEDTRERMLVQQDGAPPHYHNTVRGFLNNHYPNRWIGRAGPIAWPPRSPDLTSPDFYLWGYLKNIVYQTQPTTEADMRNRIRNACENIPRNVLLSTVRHFQRRVNACIFANGGHFEHIFNG